MSPVVRVSRVHHPVTVLGPGTRVGIWTQGCSIGCAGCVSRDTWDPDAGTVTSVDELVDSVAALVDGGPLDGVTISGGEPFEQADALRVLVPALRARLDTADHAVDVLVYSGYEPDILRRDHGDVLELLDVVVAGPYVAAAGEGGRWRGSANQTVEVLSALGARRIADVDLDVGDSELQVAVDDDGVWIVGIPRRGDMNRLERGLAERGVRLWHPSWRR